MKQIGKLKKVKLSEMVASEMKEYIIKNRMKPGDTFPSEIELSRIMEVGRSSVREGIKTLQNLGIVESRNKKGLVVKETNLSLLQDYLQFHIDNNRLDRRTIYEALKAIHLGIIPIIIKRITDEDIKKLENLLADWEKNYTDTSFSRQKDIEFHKILFEIANNEIVMQFNNLLKEYFLGKKSVLNTEVLKVNLDMHKDIVSSLKEKDLMKTINAFNYHNEFPQISNQEI